MSRNLELSLTYAVLETVMMIANMTANPPKRGDTCRSTLIGEYIFSNLLRIFADFRTLQSLLLRCAHNG